MGSGPPQHILEIFFEKNMLGPVWRAIITEHDFDISPTEVMFQTSEGYKKITKMGDSILSLPWDKALHVPPRVLAMQ